MTVLPGIDLVETGRIGRIIERQGEAFLRRVFTAAERAYCDSHANATASYAARWAAKEAVAKALGTGIGADASFVEIEVVRSANGQPRIQLHGNTAATAKRMGVSEVRISLTHTEQYAAAIAVITLGAPGAPGAPAPLPAPGASN
jgi:holo-[acyl-carrier protein] synthase